VGESEPAFRESAPEMLNILDARECQTDSLTSLPEALPSKSNSAANHGNEKRPFRIKGEALRLISGSITISYGH
jgi:hypothetical protein